ncbi:MAG TPA: GvpL/GvpF family gas vesicle protein [Solirubrobacteraceae bacterium]|nr:GvpL/GvpF family gas vesicle protein [Solirubrobacteraceae bacterium]
MIYVYAISEPPVPAPALRRRGLGGATLRTLARDGLVAVYSRHRSLHPHPQPDLVLHHERVVEAIMATGVVLPLRFGTQLAGEDRLGDLLAARHDELTRSLERVRGRTELGVRVMTMRSFPGGEAGESTGRDYLLGRVRRHRRHEEAVRDVHAALGALSAASCIRPPGTAPAILVAAYLVDDGRVAEFRRQADQLAGRPPGTRLMVTGPWPPYSFATEQR